MKTISLLLSVALLFILIICLTFCVNQEKKNVDNGAIAKAYENYFYERDLQLPNTFANQADSLNEINRQLNRWFTSKIVTKQAQSQLSEDVKQEIAKKVKEYEQELLEFAYQSEIVRQKMDTVVADSVIEQYYNKYLSTYLLDEAYLRFIYIKCDKVKYVKEVKKWMKDSIDLYNLEDFCKEELQECHLYANKWLPIKKFQSKFEGIDLDINKIKNEKKLYEVKIDNVSYLFRILEFKDKGSPAPISFVKTNIRTILLNKRKSEFLNIYLNNFLDNEMDKGNIKILD